MSNTFVMVFYGLEILGGLGAIWAVFRKRFDKSVHAAVSPLLAKQDERSDAAAAQLRKDFADFADEFRKDMGYMQVGLAHVQGELEVLLKN